MVWTPWCRGRAKQQPAMPTAERHPGARCVDGGWLENFKVVWCRCVLKWFGTACVEHICWLFLIYFDTLITAGDKQIGPWNDAVECWFRESILHSRIINASWENQIQYLKSLKEPLISAKWVFFLGVGLESKWSRFQNPSWGSAVDLGWPPFFGSIQMVHTYDRIIVDDTDQLRTHWYYCLQPRTRISIVYNDPARAVPIKI